MRLFEFFRAIKDSSDLSASLLLQALPLSALVLYSFMLRQKKLSSYTNQNKSTNEEKQNIVLVAELRRIPEGFTRFAECEATQLLSQVYESQCANARPSGLAPPALLKKYVNDKMNSLFARQAKDASLELSDEQAYDYFLILYFLISRKRDKYTNDINRLKAIPAIFEFWMINVVCKKTISYDALSESNCTTPESSG